ncbi:Heterokaryon incompatibility protein [Rutstroemia sp. NJR-2017a BBW]|nr:Heterokaryon incompatibility protein [Rutstroemia sp. NJR-2017a BBW]
MELSHLDSWPYEIVGRVKCENKEPKILPSSKSSTCEPESMALRQAVEYRPLSSNSIRLFRFDNSAQGIISGEMKSFTLEEPPPYYALSYCWGPRKESSLVGVNGGGLHVSRSLNDALKRLQQFTVTSGDLSHSTIWIWADQLCINQQDNAERSKQVALMGTIYKQAIRTIVWLGDDSDSNSSAWTLVDKIYDIFRERYPKAQTVADIPFAVYSESKFQLSGLPKWDDTKWQHFKHLLGIPWFTRVWVIQEVALSAKDPIILHGQHQYPWHKLSWAAAWLRRRGYTRLEHIPAQLLNVDVMSCIRRSNTPWALDVLLCLTSTKFQATDQRDKVYGLLGLTKEGQDLTNLPDALRPDYGLDVVETYKKVALYIFNKYNNLSTLTRTNTFATSEGISPTQSKHVWEKLPSWVPNWSDSIVVERHLAKSLSWISHSHETDEGILGFPNYYMACGGLALQIHQSKNLSILKLNGLRVDTILRSVRLTDGIESGGRRIDDCHSMIWKTAAPLLSVWGAAEWLTTYIKATTAGHYLIGGRTEAQAMRDGSAYLLGLLSRNENLSTDSTSANSTSELISLLQSLSIGGDAEVYTSISYNFCFQRSFFVTMQGRIGIGPLVTEYGDQIAILLGGEVPYVLRSRDSITILLGESYVHGLIQGEMVQGLRTGILSLEVIEIH